MYLLSESLWERAMDSLPRFPWIRTLTNRIGVSDIGGAKKCCCFTDRIRQESYLLVHSAGLDTSPPCTLLIGRSVIQLRPVIFSNARLAPHLRVGPVSFTRCQTLQLSRCGVWTSKQTKYPRQLRIITLLSCMTSPYFSSCNC